MKLAKLMLLIIWVFIMINIVNAQTTISTERGYDFKKTCYDNNVCVYSMIPHYLDNGTWKEVNTTITDVSVTYKGNPYTLKGITAGRYQAFFRNNANSDYSLILRYGDKLVGQTIRSVAYYEKTTKNWTILSTVQSSILQVNGNTATYENIFPQVDLTYEYEAGILKEKLHLKQNNLPDPTSYGYNPDKTWLVGVFEIDFGTLNISKNGVNFDTIEINESLDFVYNNQKLFSFPTGYAYDNNGKMKRVLYKFINFNNKKYLLFGVPYNWLNNATYPVYIDPTYDDFEDASINTTLWNIDTGGGGAATETGGYLQLQSNVGSGNVNVIAHSNLLDINQTTTLNITIKLNRFESLGDESGNADLRLNFINNSNTSVQIKRYNCDTGTACSAIGNGHYIWVLHNNQSQSWTLEINGSQDTTIDTSTFGNETLELRFYSQANSGGAGGTSRWQIHELNYTTDQIPNITSSSLTPTRPVTTNNLTCNATVFDTEGENTTVFFEWYKNDTLNLTGNKTDVASGSDTLISTIESVNTTKNQNWTCETRAFDDPLYSTRINTSTIIIVNSVPTVSSVSISSPIGTSETANCTWTQTDADLDVPTNETRWYNNTIEVVELRNSTNASSGNTTTGQQWICSVRVSDGINSSAYSNSSTVTIGDNVAPTITNVSLATTSITTAQTLNFTANCTDVDSNINSFIFTLNISDGSEINRSFTINTSASSVNSTYTLFETSETANVGSYNVTDIYCTDSSSNTNRSQISGLDFTVTAVSTSSSSPGGGGVPAFAGILECKVNETVLWRVETEQKSDFYEVLLPRTTARPRKKPILFENPSNNNVTLSIACEDTLINTTKGICQFVELSSTKLNLAPSTVIEITETISINPPTEASYGESFFFNIFVSDNINCEGRLGVEAKVSRLGNFWKWINIPVSKLKSDVEDKAFPYILIAFVLAIVMAWISWLITSQFTSGGVVTFVVVLSFFGSLILLIVLV